MKTAVVSLWNEVFVQLHINQLLWVGSENLLFMHKIKNFLRILIIHVQGQNIWKAY